MSIRFPKWALPLLGILLLSAPALAEDTPPPAPAEKAKAGEAKPPAPVIPTLREAVRKGVLDAGGSEPSSYRRVKLHLRNRTTEPLSVDICGSHLVPRSRGSCQRLGLGPVVTPREARRTGPGTMVVDLKPGEAKQIEVHTCCLDAGKAAPTRHKFVAARSKLPDVRVKVLRWWADNPEAPQHAVNSAIWQSRPTVSWDPNDKKSQQNRRSHAYGAASNAGSSYLLRDGELMVRDPDGILRFLGTDILAVHPTDSAVYAEALGRTAHSTIARPRELWRLVPTGEEPWRLVATLPHDLRLQRLHVAPTGAVLLICANGLYRVNTERKRVQRLVETAENGSLSLRFLRRGRVQYTLRTKSDTGYYQGGELKGATMPVCEIWNMDLSTFETERVRKFWNVKEVRMGQAGVFALTPGGKLRRLQGKSFRNIGGTISYERIVFVGRKHLWVESGAGRLIALSTGGKARFQAGPRVPACFGLDRHNDEILYFRDGDFLRIEPGKGKRTPVSGE